MHIGNRFATKPYECIAYKPPAKNNPEAGLGVIYPKTIKK